MTDYLLHSEEGVHAARHPVTRCARLALTFVLACGINELGVGCSAEPASAAADAGTGEACAGDDECRAQGLDWVCEGGRCQQGCVFDQDCAAQGAGWGCSGGHCRPSGGADLGPDAPDVQPGMDLGPPVVVCDPPCVGDQVCERGRCQHRCQAALACAEDAVIEVDSFSIDVHEASRPDATDTELGCNRSRACSVGGRHPWTELSWSEASAACGAAGKRLCTESEWRRACEGLQGRRFPYGDAFDATLCNGAGQGRGLPWPTGSGPDCRSLHGALDLSGNVHEWIGDELGARQRGTLGGNYQSNMTQSACDYALRQEDISARDPGVGFRCCR